MEWPEIIAFVGTTLAIIAAMIVIAKFMAQGINARLDALKSDIEKCEKSIKGMNIRLDNVMQGLLFGRGIELTGKSVIQRSPDGTMAWVADNPAEKNEG